MKYVDTFTIASCILKNMHCITSLRELPVSVSMAYYIDWLLSKTLICRANIVIYSDKQGKDIKNSFDFITFEKIISKQSEV